MVWLQYQETCCLPNDDEFISSEIGCTPQEWIEAKSELLNPHRPILSLNQETNSLFFNGLAKERDKQMDRRERLRQNGRLGGRPKNQKVISEEPKQKAGSENLNERLPSPSPSPSPNRERGNGAPLPCADIKIVFDNWNQMAQRTGLPQCLVVSDKRRRFLATRLKDDFFNRNWRAAIQKISESKFCLGESDRGWRASFDWFISPDTVAKVMEGKYESVQRNGNQHHRPVGGNL